MTAREADKGFVRVRPVLSIGAQNFRHHFRRLFRFHILIKLGGNAGVFRKAAADENVIALDRVALVIHRHARADQSDVADVMLRA